MAMITIIAVFLLIGVGGIVRSTGSGMGCPDWPKCFGQWVPPTDISQLPLDYKSKFKVMNREIADFNVFHTWTEYINRLLGVLIGFFVILTCWFGWKVRKKNAIIWWLSFAALVLVLLEGWLGSIVVKTDLHKGIVTIHMIGSVLIIMVLIFAILIGKHEKEKTDVLHLNIEKMKKVHSLGILTSIGFLAQVLIGTQVRENVDEIQKIYNNTARNQWIDTLGNMFDLHQFFYIVPLIGLFFWFKLILELGISAHKWIRNVMKMIATIILLEVAVGWILSNYSLPPFFQPIHLTLGVLLYICCFTMQLEIYIMTLTKKNFSAI